MTQTAPRGGQKEAEKPRVRYRPGHGFYNIQLWNAGFAVVRGRMGATRPWEGPEIERFDNWREILVGPFETLHEALCSVSRIETRYE